jgi:methionyl-tRNA synthetase
MSKSVGNVVDPTVLAERFGVDALTTYMTGVGYGQDQAEYARYWPADVHLIGKDIVRFHAVYWPAFLMSANLSLPKQVFGHGFLLARGEKMSKSLGNVVDPMELATRYGVDALRYFLLREVSFGQDGSYSNEAIVNRVNSELANSFGNLAQRSLSMIFKNLDGILPAVGEAPEDVALLADVRTACATLEAEFDRFAFSVGLEAWMGAVFACNQYVDAMAPWALKKSDPQRMAAVLGTLVVAVRMLAEAVMPIIPASAEKLIALIDSGSGGVPIAQPTPIFPRLELPEEEEAA